MPTPGNAINEATTGITGFTGTAFVGTPVTQYNILTGAATSSAVNNVAPSATSGVPVISQGAASQPIFGTAVVAGGGTGQTTLTNHGVLVGAATSAITQLSAGSAGQVLQSGGASADPAYSTATYPSTSGTSGNVLTSDGTNWNSTAVASSFSPNSVVNYFDDFLGVASANGSYLMGWATVNFTTVTVNDLAHPGIANNASFAANSAFIKMQNAAGTAVSQIVLGGGALSVNWVVKLAALSDGTNTYTFRCGLGDTTNADEVNGVYFEYSNGLNSGNWVGKTASASSRTPANSAVAAINSAYVNLGITVNAAATSVGFFINGVQIANSPLALTIPTAPLFPFVDIVRSAGTIAASSILVDLFYLTQTLTTPR